MAGQESKNLPFLPDLPMNLSQDQWEFLSSLKELLERMLGRRGELPLTPQMEIGRYVGDGIGTSRLIETSFRPRYIRIFMDPTVGSPNNWIIEYLDDPDNSIDWEGYTIYHWDSSPYHTHTNTAGITSVTDEGFYVWGGSAGTSDPNILNTVYNYIIFG